MGKKDPSQRTKGNTKAASSARSAQLLGDSGVGFVGFGTSTEAGFVPLLQGSAGTASSDDSSLAVSTAVPADFRLVLRKVLKKDATTRLKAMQEFLDLTHFASEADMIAILPHWPSVYNKMAVDADRRVRELAHLAQAAVARAVGKNLGPHLKTIAAVWFIGQSDPHLPAATAAANAWKVAFPEHKLAGAIEFCHKEIISQIVEYLTKATPQTLSDPKITTPEEMEAKFVRTLSMSLVSYSKLCSLLEKLQPEEHSKLLDNAKFWKFSKHKSVEIRRGFFMVIQTLALKYPDTLLSRGSQVMVNVLGNLADSEASREMWPTILSVLQIFKDTAWNHVSGTKMVFPGLFKILAQGGNGHATVIYPNLMPFLNCIPPSAMENEERFYNKWFSSFVEGMDNKKVRTDEAEITAILNAMSECLFLLMNKESINIELRQMLLKDYLLKIVNQSLMDEKLAKSSFLEELTRFLVYWNNISSSKSDIAQLNALFWSDFKYNVLQELESDCTIVCVLKIGRAVERRLESGSKENDEQSTSSQMIDELVDIVCCLVKKATQLMSENKAKADFSLDILSQIFAQFGQYKSVFSRLCGQNCDSMLEVEFYKTTVLPLTQDLSLERRISLFTWKFINHMTDDESLSILESFVTQSRPIVILHLMNEAASDKANSSFVQKWISCNYMLNILTELADRSIKDLTESKLSTCENWKIVKSVLTSGIVLPDKVLQNLLEIFKRGIQSLKNGGHKGNSSRLVEFVAELLIALLVSQHKICLEEGGIDVLKMLFSLDTSTLSKEVSVKVESCWKQALEVDDGWSPLAEFISTEIGQRIAEPMLYPDLETLTAKAKKFVNILKSKYGVQSNEVQQAVLAILKHSGSMDCNEQHLYDIVFYQKTYLSQISDKFENSLIVQTEVEKSSLVLPNNSFLFVNIVSQLLDVEPIQGDSFEVSGETINDFERIDFPESLISHEIFLQSVLNVPLAVAYMNKLILNRNANQDIIDLETKLDYQATHLYARLTKPTTELINSKLSEKSESCGSTWTLALCWNLLVAYRYSEWNVALHKFVPKFEEEVNDNSVSTAAAILHLMAKLNLGTGELTNTLNREIELMSSSEQLDTNKCSFAHLWLLGQCIQLTKLNSSKWHLSQGVDCDDKFKSMLNLLLKWRTDREDDLLYGSDLSEKSWREVSQVATVANFLAIVLSKCPEMLSNELWDFLTCSLVSWAGSLEESKERLTSQAAPLLFAVQISGLANQAGAILGPAGHHPALSPPVPVGQTVTVPEKLREEWREFFCEGVFATLLPLFISVTAGKEHLYTANILAKAIGEAIVHCPADLILSIHLPPLYLVQDVDAPALPDNITFIFNHFGPLLISSCRASQVASAHILASITAEVAKAQEKSSEEEELEIPRRLLEVIEKGEVLLSSMLADFDISEPVGEIPTGTVAFSTTIGYLLAWKVVLKLLSKASDELRPKYSEFIENKGHMKHLLENLFRLMPHYSSARIEQAFEPVNLNVGADPASEEIQGLAATMWLEVCQLLPALARQWWQKLDKNSQTTVEKVTSNMVTPSLWRHEVNVISGAQVIDNLTMKVRESVREVVATYSIDEGSMELLVSLPTNYPLGDLSVESGKRVGVETGQWRKWLLQLTTFLTHQNGSIHDGLNLWKKNVDKRFEGVEECYICFYILHGSNHQLPKLACRTCKKKFHSACLYKWFSTSNNSSCPLCRNLF